MFLNAEFDEFITIDEMTTDVRSNSKTWGVSFPWPHYHSCPPAADHDTALLQEITCNFYLETQVVDELGCFVQ